MTIGEYIKCFGGMDFEKKYDVRGYDYVAIASNVQIGVFFKKGQLCISLFDAETKEEIPNADDILEKIKYLEYYVTEAI